MLDLGTLGVAAGTLAAGYAAWRQSRASDFTAITTRLDGEVKALRTQQHLTVGYTVSLMEWARKVPPGPAGDPPDPPAELDLSPWYS